MRMGKASRTKQAPDRRARVAAQREEARRAEQRKRIYLAGGSILAVIIVVVAFVIIKSNGSGGSGSGGSNGPTGTALSAVVNQTTSVPAATLDTVGAGSGQVTAAPVKITGNQPPLTSGGKPEMLYMGAEYCPYCAAERWSMIVALSRFGTFSGLATIHSAAADGGGQAEPYPNTPTWTFVNANYTSKYLTFQHVEENTNIPDASNGFYTALQTPTSAQQALLQKYDNKPYSQVDGRLDPVHRLRQQVHDRRRQLQPAGAGGQDLGADRRRAEDPVEPDRPGRRRHRELHHRCHLPADRQPAGQRVHTRGDVARKEPLTGKQPRGYRL